MSKAAKRLSGKSGENVVSVWTIQPSPENDKLYRPVDDDDPEIIALAESIQQHGLRESIVITRDGWIVSGHRRYAACMLAGVFEVRVVVLDYDRTADLDYHTKMIREYNRQRDKSNAERLREEIVSSSTEETCRLLAEHRTAAAMVHVEEIVMGKRKPRSQISAGKRAFADAITQIVYRLRPYWPLSERMVHYRLLDEKPLRSEGKLGKLYVNDRASSSDLSDMIVRMRLNAEIPWEAIHDPTRPVTVWDVYDNPRLFLRAQLEGFMKGYYRNLMRSQPNHVEIVVEKNTVEPILKPIAMKYTIPMTSGRGFTSHPPLRAIQQRFLKSGKENLILITASDFDPSGESISESVARILRDDYGVDKIIPLKACLTAEQVRRFKLPPMMTVHDKRDSRKRAFEAKNGENVYELEALSPDQMRELLTNAIDSVIDHEAFNRECVAQDDEDVPWLAGVRQLAAKSLADLGE